MVSTMSYISLDVAHFLSLFQVCLVHIINYNGLDIPPPPPPTNGPQIMMPIVVSRYDYTPLESASGITQYMVKKSGIVNSNSDFPFVQRDVRHGRKCTVTFYLYPPPEGIPYNSNMVLFVPEQYSILHKGFYTRNRYDVGTLVNSRSNYHILVQEEEVSYSAWNVAMSAIIKRYPGVQLFVLETSGIRTMLSVALKSIEIGKSRKYVKIPEVNLANFTKTSIDDALKFILKDYSSETNLWELAHTKDDSAFLKNQRGRKSNGNFDTNIDFLLMDMISPNFTFIPESKPNCRSSSKNNINNTIPCDEWYRPRKVDFHASKNLGFYISLDYFSFVSCGRVVLPKFSLSSFISAFDVPTWCMVLIIYLIIPFLLYVRNKKDVDYLFDGLRILLDQDVSLMMRKAISTKRYLSPFVISTLLAALVLCNAYKGKCISCITSPILPKPIAKFEELHNCKYKLFTKFDSSAIKTIQEEGLAILNNTAYLQALVDKYKLSFITSYMKQMNGKSILRHVTYSYDEAQAVAMGWNNFSLVRELEKCEDMGLTGGSTEMGIVEKELKSRVLHQKDKKMVSVGMDTQYERARGWEITGWTDDKIFSRMKSVKESGLLERLLLIESSRSSWRDEGNNNNNYNINETGKLERIQDTTTNYNVGSDRFLLGAKGLGIFVLLAGGVGFSVICFLIEKFSCCRF
jgi:TM2 domain-containing membrane protein YozV